MSPRKKRIQRGKYCLLLPDHHFGDFALDQANSLWELIQDFRRILWDDRQWWRRGHRRGFNFRQAGDGWNHKLILLNTLAMSHRVRSEERRVGKECRSRWS